MSVIDILIIVLLIAWLGGFSLRIAGNLIHILLIIALIGVIYRLFNG